MIISAFSELQTKAQSKQRLSHSTLSDFQKQDAHWGLLAGASAEALTVCGGERILRAVMGA